MNVQELVKCCSLELMNKARALPDRTVAGCYIGDLLSSVMAHAREGEVWLTIQTHQNVVAVAVLLNLAGVIFLEGYKPREDTIEKADKEGVTLLCTDLSAFELAGLLYTKGIRRYRE